MNGLQGNMASSFQHDANNIATLKASIKHTLKRMTIDNDEENRLRTHDAELDLFLTTADSKTTVPWDMCCFQKCAD